MWWTLSSGQESVPIMPAWYEDCCIIISYSSTHITAFVGNYYFFSVYDVQDGMTPLMGASLNGHVEVVRALIGSQAQVNTQDKVCSYSYHQNTHTAHHTITQSVTIYSCTSHYHTQCYYI